MVYMQLIEKTKQLRLNPKYLFPGIKKKIEPGGAEPSQGADTQQSPRLDNIYTMWIAETRLIAKPNTMIKYKSVYKNHIGSLSNIPVDDIDRNLVTLFTADLRDKGLSNKTINDILIVLNMLLRFAAEEYGISIPKIKYLKEDKKEPRCLSIAEQKQLIEYLSINSDVHKFGVLIALYTGIRIGELCALRWEDITPETITVNKTMARVSQNGKSEVIIQPPKSENSVRVIPFPPELLKYYNSLKGEGYVLSTASLKYTEPRYLQMIFSRYVKECGLTGVTFHTLRHTFATRCIEAGVDAKTVSELLGHSDTKITLNRYVHSSFELKQTSIEKMQTLLA